MQLHYRVVLALFIMGTGVNYSYAAETLSDGQLPSKDKQARYKVLDFFTEATLDVLGAQSASVDFEESIRTILADNGYSFAQSITIRRFNPYLVRENAAVLTLDIGFSSIQFMFIDEKWLKSMPYHEMEMIILHEATHLAESHQLVKMVSATGLCWLGLQTLKMASPLFLKKFAHGRAPQNASWLSKQVGGELDIVKFVSCLIALELATDYALAKISRYCEYRADAGAVSRQGTVEHGKKVMARFEAMHDDFESHCSQHTWVKKRRKVMQYIGSFFASHPSPEDRVKAMEAIKDYI